MNICGENRHLRQARNRYVQPMLTVPNRHLFFKIASKKPAPCLPNFGTFAFFQRDRQGQKCKRAKILQPHSQRSKVYLTQQRQPILKNDIFADHMLRHP
jgi:hypothetical protein